ncbi:MAG TPA: GNAT family N-acetyltransferase, partial [Stellaceae bacterium]|nr:GNAT family N-acetyltransferase [Stellaceae bacterium]
MATAVPDAKPIFPLGPHHDRQAFSSGEPSLDIYLQRQASQDIRRRVAQVFVLTGNTPESIAGYYSLSAASFERTELPETQAKRLPHYPVPAAILGRLAVDRLYQGKRHGETLLLDAVHRVVQASAVVAMNAVLVDALNDAAVRFYLRYGFIPLLTNPRRLFLSLDTFIKAG